MLHARLFSSAALALIATSSVAPAQSTPVFKHRQGGLIHDVFVMPDGLTAWTVEDGGRIRKTTNGYEPGSTVFQTTPDDVRVQLNGIFFMSNGLEGWAVGEKSTIVRTTDGGATWTRVALDPATIFPFEPAELWDVHFVRMGAARHGWIAGKEGVIWKSIDGGLTWTSQHNNLYDVSGVHITIGLDEDKYGIHFVSDPSTSTLHGWFTGDNGAIFHTTDAGASWHQLNVLGAGLGAPAVNIELWDIEVASNGSGYASGGVGTGLGRVYRITNWTSVSWQPAGAANPSPVPPTANSAPAADCDGVPVAQFSATTLYGLGLLADGRMIACGYGANAWRGVPASGTCESITPCIPVGAVVKPPMFGAMCVGNTAYTVGTFNTIRKATDANAAAPTWVNKAATTAARFWDGDFVSDTEGWMVGQQNVVYHTTDGGRTLVEQYFTQSPQVTAASGVSMFDARAGVVVGLKFTTHGNTRSLLLWTGNGGTKWRESIVPASFAALDPDLQDAFCSTARRVWVCGDAGTVLVSNDGGASFADADPFNVLGLVNLESIAGVVSYAKIAMTVGAGGKAFRFDGANPVGWSLVPVQRLDGSRFTGAVHGVAMITPNLAYACGDEGRVFRWTGTVFSEVYQQSSRGPLWCVEAVPGTSEVFSGGDDGVVVHFDGNAWSEPKSNTSHPIYGLAYLSPSSGWLIGRNNGLMRWEP